MVTFPKQIILGNISKTLYSFMKQDSAKIKVLSNITIHHLSLSTEGSVQKHEKQPPTPLKEKNVQIR